ncbi:hypothetical protein U1Q18_002588 [Sarracenia purpurea var. burkii]
MAALSSSLISVRNSQTHSLSGLSLMEVNQCLSSRKLFISTNYQTKAKVLKYGRSFTVQASGDGGRPSTASIFVGGFVLGGIVVGTLGCIYAPQVSVYSCPVVYPLELDLFGLVCGMFDSWQMGYFTI